MDRLKIGGDNEYEVLGLSPSATTDDINAAFHHLIDEGNYREGVPLRSQWQRAREIKAAHAILIDPVARAKYDGSLSRVQPFGEPPADKRTGFDSTDAEQPAAATPPFRRAATASAFAWGPTPDNPARKARHVVVPGLVAVGPTADPIPTEAGEPEHEDVAAEYRPSPRMWASAGTAALAAGLLLYVFSPDLMTSGRGGSVPGADRTGPGSAAAVAQSSPPEPGSLERNCRRLPSARQAPKPSRKPSRVPSTHRRQRQVRASSSLQRSPGRRRQAPLRRKHERRAPRVLQKRRGPLSNLP